MKLKRGRKELCDFLGWFAKVFLVPSAQLHEFALSASCRADKTQPLNCLGTCLKTRATKG